MNSRIAGGGLGVEEDLTALGRFNPEPGFENRVLASVRHPLPRWTRRVRDAVRGMITGPRGWVVLASASLATAGLWAVGIAGTVRLGEYTNRGGELAFSEVVLPAWREATFYGSEQVNEVAHSVSGALGMAGIPWLALTIGYGAVVVVSAVALRLLTRPSRARANR